MAKWDSGENAAHLGGQLKRRHAMRAIPLLMAIGPLLARADQLPAYCGGVGAKSYTPPVVTIPAVVLNRGTVITVTNATMLINGDTSSVKALVANPGPGATSPSTVTSMATGSPISRSPTGRARRRVLRRVLMSFPGATPSTGSLSGTFRKEFSSSVHRQRSGYPQPPGRLSPTSPSATW